METLQKNILLGLLLILSISTNAQKNQVPVIVNGCFSGYSTTLLLENQIAIDSNSGVITSAAPLFTVDIRNRWGYPVDISNLSYSFKITNYSSNQSIDFENFDYLNEAYISNGYSISSNGDGYDVELTPSLDPTGSTFLIDDRSGLVVSDVLERSLELYRNDNILSDIGYTIEISNVQFKKASSNLNELCATDFTQTILLELEGSQKISPLVNTLSQKKQIKNIAYSFPNPIKDLVYINLFDYEKNSQNYSVHIYNTNGQIMLKQKWNAYKAIRLNNLEKGIYSLSLLDSHHQIMYSNKIIVE